MRRRRRSAPVRGLVAAAVAIALVSAACSLGPREDWSEAMRDAYERAAEHGTVNGRLGVSLETIESTGTSQRTPLLDRLDFVVDFDAGASRLHVRSPEEHAGDDLLISDLALSVPRSAAGEGDEGWARYDFTVDPPDDEEIDVGDRRFAVGFAVLPPAIALELLEGVLTGSVENEGDDEIDGVAVEHYSGRVSIDQAAIQIDDEHRREGIRRMFEIMGMDGDIIDVEAWIDGDGLARRVTYELRQRQDNVNIFGLRLEWVYFGFGSPVDAPLPPEDGVLEVDGFEELVVEYIREQVGTPVAEIG